MNTKNLIFENKIYAYYLKKKKDIYGNKGVIKLIFSFSLIGIIKSVLKLF